MEVEEVIVLVELMVVEVVLVGVVEELLDVVVLVVVVVVVEGRLNKERETALAATTTDAPATRPRNFLRLTRVNLSHPTLACLQRI